MDLSCHKLLFKITEQELALEFVLLHIISGWPIGDFGAQGRRMYCLTNQIGLFVYVCGISKLLINSLKKVSTRIWVSKLNGYKQNEWAYNQFSENLHLVFTGWG